MPRTSRRLRASERRAQLIDTGRATFAEHGYEATSVEEIAKRANVSKPIIYRVGDVVSVVAGAKHLLKLNPCGHGIFSCPFFMLSRHRGMLAIVD